MVWVIDHITFVIMDNDYRVSSHGVGTIYLLLSLSINSVLYVSRSLFNLLSISCLTRFLNCVMFFTKDSACLHDQSLERIIDAGCESCGLYHLQAFAHVDSNGFSISHSCSNGLS